MTKSNSSVDPMHVFGLILHLPTEKRYPPSGEAAFTALNIALEKLKVPGEIQKIYRSAGFLVDPTKFRILNSTMPVN